MQYNSSFRIGDWQVEPALNLLRKTDLSVSVEPKVMAVLVLLASRPGEVFSRQELEEAIWKGTIVGYDALAKAINKLREALGDDKKNPRYIQTIPKKGYRLVAEVVPGLASETQPSATTEHVVKHPGRAWLLPGIGTGILALLLVVGLLISSQEMIYISEPVAIVKTNPEQVSKPTIVVLPFRNISPSNQDDYLADGLTSDLTTNLSRLSGLWVTASNATLIYKNISVSPEQIKKEFNARYVVNGEVSKIAKALRINVRLTDLDTGKILWADRYDRQFTDLFSIQDEVTNKIIQSLSLILTNEEKLKIAKRYTSNLEAYEIFLRAQYLLGVRTPEDNINARELYERAIELDPGFARAYAGISYSYSIGYLRQWPADTDQPLEKALELANQAIKIDKDLPESYWAAAFVYFYKSDLDTGDELLQKALILNPNYADAYALLAANSISKGNPGRSLEIMSRAFQLNPAGGYLYEMQLGRAHYFLNNYELARKHFIAALERNPTVIDTQMYNAAIYVRLGRLDEAGWMILEAQQASPGFDPIAWANAYPFADNKGYRKKLLADIAEAEKYAKE